MAPGWPAGPLRRRGQDRAALGSGDGALPARARRPCRFRPECGVAPGWPASPLRLATGPCACGTWRRGAACVCSKAIPLRSGAWGGARMAGKLSVGDDKTVRLWEVETGRCLRMLEGHTAYVWSVAWQPGWARKRSPPARTNPSACGTWRRGAACACSKAILLPSRAWRGARMASKALSTGDDKTVRLWDVERALPTRARRPYRFRLERGVAPGWPASPYPPAMTRPSPVGRGDGALPARAQRPYRFRQERGVAPGWTPYFCGGRERRDAGLQPDRAAGQRSRTKAPLLRQRRPTPIHDAKPSARR